MVRVRLSNTTDGKEPMTRRPTARFEAGLTVLALALTLAACSTQEPPAKVNAKVIEVEVAQQLLAEGAVAATPTIDCGEDLVTLVEGGEVDCTMAVAGKTGTAAVTVTISDVKGTIFKLDTKLADNPA